MGNSQLKLEYNEQFGDHQKNLQEQTITKYYVLSSKSEQQSFLSLVAKYSSQQIPTIVPILKCQRYQEGQQEYCWRLQMKYYSKTLEDEIINRRQYNHYFEEIQILRALDCILSGLVVFSRNRMVHGDIRPANVFQDSHFYNHNRLAIYLLGLPLLTNHKCLQKSVDTPKEKLIYLSPEYLKDIQNGRHKPSISYENSDVFALGMTILEMASLSHIPSFYNFNEFQVDFQKIKAKIYNCQLRYSLQFCKLLGQMLEQRSMNRATFSDIFTSLNHMLITLEKSQKRGQKRSGQLFIYSKSSLWKSSMKPGYRVHEIKNEKLVGSIFRSPESIIAWNKYKQKNDQHNKMANSLILKR